MALDKKTLDLDIVFSKGRFMIRHGKVIANEKFLEGSNRVVHLVGEDAEEAK